MKKLYIRHAIVATSDKKAVRTDHSKINFNGN